MTRKLKRVSHYNRYSPSLKRRIAQSYISGEASYSVLAEENGLDNKGVVKEFVRWYRKELTKYPKPSSTMSVKKSKSSQSIAALKAENARLKRELEAAQLRAEAFETMIDIAESEFQIPIRKKSGAKQSKT